MTDAAAAVSEGGLVGRAIPSIVFPSTTGSAVQLADTLLGDFVLFIYPRIARPNDQVSAEWLRIPGAKGCTAESCEFRDLADDFRGLGLSIYGLSTQDTGDQAQAVQRLHLSYPLLSDPGLTLQRALGCQPSPTKDGRCTSAAPSSSVARQSSSLSSRSTMPHHTRTNS